MQYDNDDTYLYMLLVVFYHVVYYTPFLANVNVNAVSVVFNVRAPYLGD